MSDMSTQAMATFAKKPIKGAGLTAPGVVILQTIFILIVETLEYAIGKIGTLTGLALLIASAAGIYLGRRGTDFVNAVNPPLAFLFSTLVVLCTLGGVGLHVARLGLDLITALAAVAPYLVIGAIGSWGNYLYKARSKKAKPE
jgi:hypothetical protein